MDVREVKMIDLHFDTLLAAIKQGDRKLASQSLDDIERDVRRLFMNAFGHDAVTSATAKHLGRTYPPDVLREALAVSEQGEYREEGLRADEVLPPF
jgi:hypothetical protein